MPLRVAAMLMGIFVPSMGNVEEMLEHLSAHGNLQDFYVSRVVQQNFPQLEAVMAADPVRRRLIMENEDEYGKTMAHIAAIYGRLKILKIMHKEDPKSISRPEKHGFTCAHVAAQSGHLHVLKWLARKDPNLIWARTLEGITPTHSAAGQGHLEIVKWLWAMNATSLYQPAKNGWTPVHTATANCRLSVIEWVWRLDHRAFTRPDNEGVTPAQLMLKCAYNAMRQIRESELFADGPTTARPGCSVI